MTVGAKAQFPLTSGLGGHRLAALYGRSNYGHDDPTQRLISNQFQFGGESYVVNLLETTTVTAQVTPSFGALISAADSVNTATALAVSYGARPEVVTGLVVVDAVASALAFTQSLAEAQTINATVVFAKVFEEALAESVSIAEAALTAFYTAAAALPVGVGLSEAVLIDAPLAVPPKSSRGQLTSIALTATLTDIASNGDLDDL